MSNNTPPPAPPKNGGGKLTSKIGAVFQRKVLGVKVLYLVGIFVLVLGIYAWRMRDTATTAVDAATDATADVGGDGSETTIPAGTAGYESLATTGTVVAAPSTAGEAGANSAITSNEQWLKAGTAFLNAQGISSTDAFNALSIYVNGGSLSVKQKGYVDRVIVEYGVPPYSDNVAAGSAVRTGYFQPEGSSAVWEFLPDGTRRWISYDEYKTLGNPAYTVIPANDPDWLRPKVTSTVTNAGTDAQNAAMVAAAQSAQNAAIRKAYWQNR